MSEHTKGFISAGCEDDPKSGDIYADDGSLIAECFVNGDPETKEANARRLAACWNACAALSTEFLEKSKDDDYAIRLIWEADGYLLQRDELLVVLKIVKQLFDEALPKFNWGASALDANAIKLLNDVPIAVNAAIAKVAGSLT